MSSDLSSDLCPATKGDIRRLEQRFEGVDQRFDGMEQRMADMRLEFGVLHEDLARKMDLLVESFMPNSDRISNHEVRLSAVETELRFLKFSRK